MRIILTGASGVGKTTILEKFDLPKVQEVARTLMKEKGIKLNEDGDDKTQKLIWDEYRKKLSNKGDYISDRGLIDVISYTAAKIFLLKDNNDMKMLHKVSKLYHKQYKELKEFIKKNPDIIYVYVPIEFEMEDDGVRSKNEDYRNLTAKLMANALNELGLEYLTVHGNIDERVTQIKDYIHAKTTHND